jgi:hypothetical protein
MIIFFEKLFGFMDILHINKQKIKLHFKQTYDKNNNNNKKKHKSKTKLLNKKKNKQKKTNHKTQKKKKKKTYLFGDC